MRRACLHRAVRGVLGLLLSGVVLLPGTVRAQLADTAGSPSKNGPLAVAEVVRNLERRNAQRAAALEEFAGTRVYRMEYRGISGDRDAEMVVTMTYRAPNVKQFSIVSEGGSKFIVEHVFMKLLEGEQEAASEENRRLTALSTENYDFALAGYEGSGDEGRYVLDLFPKTRNKFLCRGKIWVDAKDFAVVRIEGEPGKSPSFWIKKTEIAHRYVKVNDFWLPAENRTESVIRLGGRAILSIEYKDYRITRATPLPEVEGAREDPKLSLVYGIR